MHKEIIILDNKKNSYTHIHILNNVYCDYNAQGNYYIR